MKILVTGGAGYIGSIMTRTLIDRGHNVTVVDSLERGRIDAVDKRAFFKKGNLLDNAFVSEIFQERFDAVIHFAAYISMEESVKNSSIYFENNIQGTRNVIEEMMKTGNNKFIFSSTAGVYGNPQIVPMPEDHPKNPTNPYGESKLRVEEMLKSTKDLNFVSLRYFNAAGATLDGALGEAHSPETHIIPLAIKAAINDYEFILYGEDYNTRDGTCIRDYIHVVDLVESHVLALEKLSKDTGGFFYNVGTGKGYTNKEVLEAIERESGKKLKIKIEGRRSGDAEALIADPTKIKEELGFTPKYSDLETIVKTAWDWHKK
jgi:UDP-glucose 4-epimerase